MGVFLLVGAAKYLWLLVGESLHEHVGLTLTLTLDNCFVYY